MEIEERLETPKRSVNLLASMPKDNAAPGAQQIPAPRLPPKNRWNLVHRATSNSVVYQFADWAMEFMLDCANRIKGRAQVTTDGHKAYLEAVETAFGADIDYAMLQKIYGAPSDAEIRHYSPAKCIGSDMKVVSGDPDPKHVSTSSVERHNLTMRMGMRRFTRLTNGFSKKFENHAAMVAIHAVYYNFARIHKTLRITPAMAAGLSDHVWSLKEIVTMADNYLPSRGNGAPIKSVLAMNNQIDEAQRVAALLDLYKHQMEHFQHTQEIEWKANFGIWTLLAASIYVVTKESVQIHRGCGILIALITIVAVHTWWLWRVHCSELADKQLWSRYRAEALAIIRGDHKIHDHEAPFTRGAAREMSWLSVEVMITVLLCVFVYTSLPT